MCADWTINHRPFSINHGRWQRASAGSWESAGRGARWEGRTAADAGGSTRGRMSEEESAREPVDRPGGPREAPLCTGRRLTRLIALMNMYVLASLRPCEACQIDIRCLVFWDSGGWIDPPVIHSDYEDVIGQTMKFKALALQSYHSQSNCPRCHYLNTPTPTRDPKISSLHPLHIRKRNHR